MQLTFLHSVNSLSPGPTYLYLSLTLIRSRRGTVLHHTLPHSRLLVTLFHTPFSPFLPFDVPPFLSSITLSLPLAHLSRLFFPHLYFPILPFPPYCVFSPHTPSSPFLACNFSIIYSSSFSTPVTPPIPLPESSSLSTPLLYWDS